ncbi:hypothetical protein U9M48_000675 [Paspalum notatum var. saurae]|uniref:HAT C-terminal dimerisation domain-containing protein n=1 Tax=Paspalum notatum var. saurae TaxID=547442 RepID=A0AAQ3SEP9_PASNO
MCVTAHFIDDDWKLHKKIIGFFLVKGHRGEDIGKSLENRLSEWGIDKVFTITVDNASSNNGAIKYMRREASRYEVCCTHYKLDLTEGLKEIDVSISRVHGSVKFIKSSPTRLAKFKKCAELAKIDSKAFLSLDVCTRWNSTYLMLSSAVPYEKAFERYKDEDPYYQLDLILYKKETEKDKDKEKDDMLNFFLTKRRMTKRKTKRNSEKALETSKRLMRNIIARKMRLDSGPETRTNKSELNKYFAEENEEDKKDFDTLKWWKDNANRFSILSRMARDLLAIPISTVASGSAFSTGGRVLDDFRSSLTPTMVERLVCTQDWLYRCTALSVEEDLEEMAKIEQALIADLNGLTISIKTNVGKLSTKSKAKAKATTSASVSKDDDASSA